MKTPFPDSKALAETEQATRHGPSAWDMERFVRAAAMGNAMFELGMKKGHHLSHDSKARSAVQVAIELDLPGALERLLSVEAHVESLWAGMSTPLAVACYFQRTDMVVILLDAGHSPDFGGIDMETPLALAYSRGAMDCAQLLLAAGANPTLALVGYKAPRFIAAEIGHSSICALIDEALALREAEYLDSTTNQAQPTLRPRL